MELDIHNLKKIKGELYEFKKINKEDVIGYKENCQNNIIRINQNIEELEYKKGLYEKEIEVANKLLAREEQ